MEVPEEDGADGCLGSDDGRPRVLVDRIVGVQTGVVEEAETDGHVSARASVARGVPRFTMSSWMIVVPPEW